MQLEGILQANFSKMSTIFSSKTSASNTLGMPIISEILVSITERYPSTDATYLQVYAIKEN